MSDEISFDGRLDTSDVIASDGVPLDCELDKTVESSRDIWLNKSDDATSDESPLDNRLNAPDDSTSNDVSLDNRPVTSDDNSLDIWLIINDDAVLLES